VSVVPKQDGNHIVIDLGINTKPGIPRHLQHICSRDARCGVDVTAQQLHCGSPGDIAELQNNVLDMRLALVIVRVGFKMHHCSGRRTYMTVRPVTDRMRPKLPTVEFLRIELFDDVSGIVNVPIVEGTALQSAASMRDGVRQVVDHANRKRFGSKPPHIRKTS
jgi:hypothetical protein